MGRGFKIRKRKGKGIRISQIENMGKQIIIRPNWFKIKRSRLTLERF